MENTLENINNEQEAEDAHLEDGVWVSLEPLMPALEIVVKKNPNQLIGCGG